MEPEDRACLLGSDDNLDFALCPDDAASECGCEGLDTVEYYCPCDGSDAGSPHGCEIDGDDHECACHNDHDRLDFVPGWVFDVVKGAHALDDEEVVRLRGAAAESETQSGPQDAPDRGAPTERDTAATTGHRTSSRPRQQGFTTSYTTGAPRRQYDERDARPQHAAGVLC